MMRGLRLSQKGAAANRLRSPKAAGPLTSHLRRTYGLARRTTVAPPPQSTGSSQRVLERPRNPVYCAAAARSVSRRKPRCQPPIAFPRARCRPGIAPRQQRASDTAGERRLHPHMHMPIETEQGVSDTNLHFIDADPASPTNFRVRKPVATGEQEYRPRQQRKGFERFDVLALFPFGQPWLVVRHNARSTRAGADGRSHDAHDRARRG